jgi:3D (Asp-Asp-Asp) domain-containing protein
MRGLIGITIAVLLVVPVALASEQSLLARVTAYWARGGKGSDPYTRQHKCATGLRLRSGHCAVDPRHIAYGSGVVLPDGTRLAAVDTGSAVRNRTAARKAGRTVYERNAMVVDRFFETKGEALTWARTHPMFMPVRVVPPNLRPTQRSQPQPQQTQIAATNSAHPARLAVPTNAPPPAKPQPANNYPLLASNDAVVRTSLNRLGR